MNELKAVYLPKLIEWLKEFGPKLAIAVAILIIGFWLTKKVVKLVKKILKRYDVDPTLSTFIANLLSVILKISVILAVVMKLGIVKESMIVTAIGASAFAIGMALQGSLANFAGGIVITFFKPFKVGDLVECQGVIGEVQEIQIFNTVLLTPQGKKAVIPNGALSNGNIINYSAKGTLRVDLVIGISYNSDIKKAKDIILKVMQNNPKVLKDPAASVSVSELADSSVNLAVRPWATTADYWDVYFETLENCKIALDEAGIEIPFPQRDVHLINPENS